MKKILIFVVLVAGGSFLWWAFSPLLFDVEVQDELDPEIAALLENSESLPVNDNVLEETTAETPELESPADSESSTSSVTDLPEPVTENNVPTPTVTGPFAISDTPGHSATGNVRVIETPEESIVRFEDYDGTNGPDLFVYLAKDLEANEFVSLGRAKGNMGNINYTVPEDVDVGEYKYVITWCKAFGVLFDYAEIQ